MYDDEIPHGASDPQRGWYDASLRAWVDNPAKLTRTEHRWAGPSAEFLREARAKSGEFTQWQRQAAERSGASFKERPDLERLIRMRESSKPEERVKYEEMVKGTLRTTIARYEKDKAKTSA